jgi:hypothetical protein
MRNVFLILVASGFLLLSCEKTNDTIIIGKDFDHELLGDWRMSYLTKDVQNNITSWTDSIKFDENNAGNRKIYRFSELEEDIPFLYYTEKDSLFLQIDQNIETWIYTIRSDSLIMTKSLSLYSSYFEGRFYKKIF